MLDRKRVSVTILLLFTLLFFFIENSGNRVTSNENGSPAGYTGSPGDNFLTCTSCHAGPNPSFIAGSITSNIPATGYVPGSTYTISATINKPGHIKSGFEISPQDLSGNQLGTMIITNAAETKLTGAGKYVTQTAGGVSSPGGQKTWSFNWTAPAAGSGNVVFYGAFCATDNGSNQSGDSVFVSSLISAECQKPQQPSTIQGNTTVCAGNSYTYRVQHYGDANNYTWSIPAGWTGSSTDTFITVIAGTTGGTISVQANNDCGAGTARSLFVTVSQISAAITATTPASCPAGSNGTATANGANGTSPYLFSWNTNPAQNTQTANGLAAGNYIVTVTDQNGCSDTAQATITSPAPIVISSNITHPACINQSNGSATATATSGGTGPYSYSWNTLPVQNSQNAISLHSGNYVVTVTDAHNCTSTLTVNVPQAPVMGVTMTSSPVLCNGGSTGSVNASPAGGTSPFTYVWNTNPVQNGSVATNLPAGNYSVTVTDANGCTASGLSIVNQPAVITISTSVTNALCFGTSTGTAVAAAAGGVGNYSYSWNSNPAQQNDTATGLPLGVYTITVTDSNGCTNSASATITQPPAITATTTPGMTSCFGGHDAISTVTASGGVAPYSFLWSTLPLQGGDTARNLPAGTFTVTVTDHNGCTHTATTTITQPPVIAPSITTTIVHCYGGNDGTAKVTATGGTGAYAYSWDTDPPQLTDSATHLMTGTYVVTVTDANGCTKTASTVINQSPAISLQLSSTTANCLQSDGTASVFASGGATAYTYTWTTQPVQHSATAHNLQAGIYGVTVTDSFGCNQQGFINVNNNTPMVLTVQTVTGVSCFGFHDGSAGVTVANATGPLTYSWLPTHDSTPIVTGLSPGLISVTVIDTNNCQVSEVITIPEPTQLVASPNTTATICSGDSIIIGGVPGASGGTPPYTFSWSPSAFLSIDTVSNPVAFPVSTTVYVMTVTDSNECVSSVTDTVNVNTIATPQILSFHDTLYSTAAPYYQWYRNDTIVVGATGRMFVPDSSGNYSVLVTDSNGCSAMSGLVSIIVGMNEEMISGSIKVFPNPAGNRISIDWPYRDETGCYLYSTDGRIISKYTLVKGINEIDISLLENGNYFFRITAAGRQILKMISVLK